MRLSELPMAALIVVFAVVTVVVGSMILGSIKESVTDTHRGVNLTAATGMTYLVDINTSLDDGGSALSNITDWADIITLVIAAAVIIGILGLMRLGGGGL